MNKKKKLLLGIMIFVLSTAVLGFVINMLITTLPTLLKGGEWEWDFGMFLDFRTWLYGLAATILGFLIWMLSGNNLDFFIFEKTGKLLGGKRDVDVVKGSLENSRFLTDKERDKYFPEHVYEELNKVTKDGIPVRAVLDKKNHLQVNFYPGAHSLVIGATGSGKTTTFINPMIQLLASTAAGSSMIMTDPKGELFDLHSAYLESRGYKGSVFTRTAWTIIRTFEGSTAT